MSRLGASLQLIIWRKFQHSLSCLASFGIRRKPVARRSPARWALKWLKMERKLFVTKVILYEKETWLTVLKRLFSNITLNEHFYIYIYFFTSLDNSDFLRLRVLILRYPLVLKGAKINLRRASVFFFSVVVLYVQGLGTKEWREVSEAHRQLQGLSWETC